MSGPRPSESRCFNENSPRPPVPGEERGGYQGRCQQSLSSSQAQPGAPLPSLLLQQQQPRRTSCDANATTTSASRHAAPLGFEPEGRSCCDDEDDEADAEDGPAKQVMDPSRADKARDEAVAVGKDDDDAADVCPSTAAATSTLACAQWTRNLRTLLEDNRGRQLFEQYLQQEGHENALAFWFACEGLKEECNLDKLSSIYKAIVRKFFQRPKLALLPEDLRKEVTRRFRDGHTDKRMFEQAQQEVERLLEETSYPNFLRSELYLKCVRDCQEAKRGYARPTKACEMASEEAIYGADECPSSPDELSLSCASSLLPTLHEDSEFSSQHAHLHQYHQQQQQQQQQHHAPGSGSSMAPASHDFAKAEMRLTKDMLMATQQYRALDVRPKPEAFAGIYLQRGASPYHASVPTKPRAQYCSYNPVSRQDSELQSLSSDARTESDNLSITDASLNDSASMVRRSTTRKQYAKQYQQMKRSAMMNRDSMPQENFIQRTQKVGRDQTQPMKPEVFANLLIEKLKRVQIDREKEERLERKLREVDQSTNYSDSLCDSSSMADMSMHQQQQLTGSCMSMGNNQPRNLTETLREKLQLDDDSSDQAILDQHVSRVWSDLTPSRSPKLSSPRPRSPDKCRRQQQQMMAGQLPMHQQMQIPGATPRPQVYRSQRKEKDVFSTFSGDSGNVHDFPEAGELHAAGSMSSLGSHHLPKSKSVPSDYADSLHKQDLYLQGQNPRYQRLDAARSSATKKSMTELTDSGVSVVSDVQPENRRLLNWLKEGAIAGCKADAASMGGSIAVSVKPSSSRKKFSNNAPKQPFVGDAGMPLLPQPHIPTQLEEAKRRLESQTDITKVEYEKGSARLERSRQRYPSSGIKQQQQLDYEQQPSPMQPASSTCMQSSQSTLRRGRQDAPLAAPLTFTIVVFSFCDEKVPYRTKITGSNITLKQFKDVLPKKGSYRYFFKTECEDLDMKVIQEEITDDAEILPLWEGKIMAQVKALE